MPDYNVIGFIVIAIVSLGVGGCLALRSPRLFPPRLIVCAIVLRILGSFARYEILYRFYDGIGDSVAYYSHGLLFAHRFWDGDLTVLGLGQWFGVGRWWGTQFVYNLSGLVITIIGPTMRGQFLVFSLLGFVGLILVARGLLAMCPKPAVVRYATWIWLWPSLWYWPSSVGKEAIVVFATGLFFFGYAGRSGRIRWGFYAAGALLAFAVRPHYAAFLILASGLTHWLGAWRGGGIRRLAESALVVLLSILALSGMTALFGIEQAGFEGMQEFLILRGQSTLTGGSNLAGLPSGISGVPQAFVNIWLRPLPWEVHNLTSLVTMLELLVLWWLIWLQRKSLLPAFRSWGDHQCLRFATIAVVGYTLMIGFTFGNLGIIARQRTPMFVFLFMVLVTAAYPVLAREGAVRTLMGVSEPRPERHPYPVVRSARLPSRVRQAGFLLNRE